MSTLNSLACNISNITTARNELKEIKPKFANIAGQKNYSVHSVYSAINLTLNTQYTSIEHC